MHFDHVAPGIHPDPVHRPVRNSLMEVAVCTGSLGKMATDLALMAQGEVAALANGRA